MDVKFDTCKQARPVRLHHLYLPPSDNMPPLPRQFGYQQLVRYVADGITADDEYGAVQQGDLGVVVAPSMLQGQVVVKFERRSVHLAVAMKAVKPVLDGSLDVDDASEMSYAPAAPAHADLYVRPAAVKLFVRRNGHFGGGGPFGGRPIKARSLDAALAKSSKILSMSTPAKVLYDDSGILLDNRSFQDLEPGAIIYASTGGAFKDPLSKPLTFLAHKNGHMDSFVRLQARTLVEALEACTHGLDMANPAQRLYLYGSPQTELLTDEDFRKACQRRKSSTKAVVHLYVTTGGPLMYPGDDQTIVQAINVTTKWTAAGVSLGQICRSCEAFAPHSADKCLECQEPQTTRRQFTTNDPPFPKRDDGRTAATSESAIRILALQNGNGHDMHALTWKPSIRSVDPVAAPLLTAAGDGVVTGQQLAVGDRVTVKGFAGQGTVRFIGAHPKKRRTAKTMTPIYPKVYVPEALCGVELDMEIGKNTGEIDGVKYFSMSGEGKEGKNYGWLGEPNKVKRVKKDAAATRWDTIRLKTDLTKLMKLPHEASKIFAMNEESVYSEVTDPDNLPQCPEALWCLLGKKVKGPVWVTIGDDGTTGRIDLKGMVDFCIRYIRDIGEKLELLNMPPRSGSGLANQLLDGEIHELKAARTFLKKHLKRTNEMIDDIGSNRIAPRNLRSPRHLDRLCPNDTGFRMKCRINCKDVGEIVEVRIESVRHIGGSTNTFLAEVLIQLEHRMGLSRPGKRLFFRDRETQRMVEIISLRRLDKDSLEVGTGDQKKQELDASNTLFTVTYGDNFSEYLNHMISLTLGAPTMAGFELNDGTVEAAKAAIRKGGKDAREATEVVGLCVEYDAADGSPVVTLAPGLGSQVANFGQMEEGIRYEAGWCNFVIDRADAQDASGRDVSSFAAFIKSKLLPDLALTEVSSDGACNVTWSKKTRKNPAQLWCFHRDGTLSSLGSNKILTFHGEAPEDRLKSLHVEPAQVADENASEPVATNEDARGSLSTQVRGAHIQKRQRWGIRQFAGITVGQWKLCRNTCVEWQHMSLVWPGELPKPVTETAVSVGDRVTVAGKGAGIARFVGNHAIAGTPRIGIELDEPRGKHNGTIKGHTPGAGHVATLHQYFLCKDLHGILVNPEIVTKDEITDTSPLAFNESLIWPVKGVLVAAAPWTNDRARLKAKMPRTTAKVDPGHFVKIQLHGQDETRSLLLRIPNALTSHCDFELDLEETGRKLADSIRDPATGKSINMPINTKEYIMKRSLMYRAGKQYGRPNSSLTSTAGRETMIRSMDSTINGTSSLVTPLEKAGIAAAHAVSAPSHLASLLGACTSALGLPANMRAKHLYTRSGKLVSESRNDSGDGSTVPINLLKHHQLIQIVPHGPWKKLEGKRGLELTKQQNHMLRVMEVESLVLSSFLESRVSAGAGDDALLTAAASRGICSATLFGDQQVEQRSLKLTVPSDDGSKLVFQDGLAVYPLFKHPSTGRLGKICTACYLQIMQEEECFQMYKAPAAPPDGDTPPTHKCRVKIDNSATLHSTDWRAMHRRGDPADHAMLVTRPGGNLGTGKIGTEKVVDPWILKTAVELPDEDYQHVTVEAMTAKIQGKVKDLPSKTDKFVCSAFTYIKEQAGALSKGSDDYMINDGAALWPRSAFLAVRLEPGTGYDQERLEKAKADWESARQRLGQLEEHLFSREERNFYAKMDSKRIAGYDSKAHTAKNAGYLAAGRDAQIDRMDVTSPEKPKFMETQDWVGTIEKISKAGGSIKLKGAKEPLTMAKMSLMSKPSLRVVTVKAWWSGDNHETIPPCRAKGRDLDELLDSCANTLRTEAKRPKRVFKFVRLDIPPVEITKDNWNTPGIQLKSNDMIFVTQGGRYMNPQEAAAALTAKGRFARS